jgi:hypothetical protein
MSHTLLTYQFTWQPRTKSQRLFASIAAIMISLGFFIQFNQPFIHTAKNDQIPNAKGLILTWFNKPLLKIEEAKKEPSSKIILSKKAKDSPGNQAVSTKISAISSSSLLTAQRNQNAAKEPISPPDNTAQQTVVATIPTQALSDPLGIATTPEPTLSAGSAPRINGRPNSAAIRAAYEASKSDIQKMADANNRSLLTTPESKYEKFQGAANRAAKPDCIRQGGSLLSLFVIAYQAATDHCK